MAQKKVILVLGGGGARGFAHIGVLRVLTEAGVKIDGIVGTSMGALIGSIFASGTDLNYLQKIVENFDWGNLVDLRLPDIGLVDGKRVQVLIELLTKNKKFDELNIPFWAVATDLQSGEARVFKEGDLSSAVRSSISLPGVFVPMKYEGHTYVDGAVVAGVPVTFAREMGGEDAVIVAVNVTFDHVNRKVNNIFDVLLKVQDIVLNKFDSMQVSMADLAIIPELGDIDVLHFQRANDCIQIGTDTTKAVLPQLLEMIKA